MSPSRPCLGACIGEHELQWGEFLEGLSRQDAREIYIFTEYTIVTLTCRPKYILRLLPAFLATH